MGFAGATTVLVAVRVATGAGFAVVATGAGATGAGFAVVATGAGATGAGFVVVATGAGATGAGFVVVATGAGVATGVVALDVALVLLVVTAAVLDPGTFAGGAFAFVPDGAETLAVWANAAKGVRATAKKKTKYFEKLFFVFKFNFMCVIIHMLPFEMVSNFGR